MSETRKGYVLGKGGRYGRIEDGKPVSYKAGDTIYMTDDEAANVRLKGRLTPLADAKLAAVAAEPAAIEVVAVPAPVAQPVKAETAPPSPPTSSVATTRDTTTAFLNDSNLSIEDIVDIISSIDDKARLDLLRETEMSVAGGQRRSIVTNAISTRKRQLQMAVAIAAKKKKAADRKAVIAANKEKAAASKATTTKATTKKGKDGKSE